MSSASSGANEIPELKGVAFEQSGVTAALRKEIWGISLLSSKLKKRGDHRKRKKTRTG